MNIYKGFFDELIAWLKGFVPSLIFAVIILVVGWWLAKTLSKSIGKAMRRAKIDESIISFFYSIMIVLFRLIVIITAAAELGINVTSLVAAIGAAGVTIGLALKDSFSNIASGILIITNKPFKIGDYLEVDNFQGTVLKIEMLFTTLTTYDNKVIVVPNSKLTSEHLINYTAQKTRRLDLCYSVSYDTDLARAKDIIREVVLNNNKSLNEPKPIIAVAQHNESSINIIAKVWCNCEDYWPLYYEMQENVKNEFDKNNISIPFNQLDVNIKKA